MTGTLTVTRILALGDSYTIGEAVDPQDRWIDRVVGQLRNRHAKMEDPIVIAKTGWTTSELLSHLSGVELPDDFDCVTLMIGVNNQYRNESIDAFVADVRRLLAFAIERVADRHARAVLLTIPDWSVTPFAKDRDAAKIAREIDSFNRQIFDLAAEHLVALVDVTKVSRLRSSDPNWLATDGLHPGPTMHEKWAAEVLPVVRACLQND